MCTGGRSTSSSFWGYRYHINTTKIRYLPIQLLDDLIQRASCQTSSDTPCNPRALITRCGGAKYDIFSSSTHYGRKGETKKGLYPTLPYYQPFPSLYLHPQFLPLPKLPARVLIFWPPPTKRPTSAPQKKKKKKHDNNSNSPHRPPPPGLNLHPPPPDLRALPTGIHPPNGLNRPIPLNPNPLTPVLAPTPDAAAHACGGSLPPAHAGVPQHGCHPFHRVRDCRAVGLWVPELRIH
ncbi:unnamed protein product [Tuber melanosporum]|uniref:(Perigord truffle) hypothetical protein n=1 Tax=Tuber melanosporum (strain Mel28) TaxID=656061 RepID=D5GNL4_TUBMM|nr:uncharacterized protein GSTUM_00011352001 [Tuber melanosporum]CAZ86107.1 unnamed protein product [Tuber melanosporum]